MARAAGRARRRDRARAPRGHRGDPGRDRPRGARVRPAAGGHRSARGIRTGVTEALRQFVALIRDPDAGRESGRDVYVGLGRGELRQGRTLDSLQSAYRVGARVAWRQISAAARRRRRRSGPARRARRGDLRLHRRALRRLGRGLRRRRSASRRASAQRRRRELLALLLRDPPADEADLRAAAQAAGWRLPAQRRAPGVAEPDLDRVARRLPTDALAGTVDGIGCVLVSGAASREPDSRARAGDRGGHRRARTDRAARRARRLLGSGERSPAGGGGRGASRDGSDRRRAAPRRPADLRVRRPRGPARSDAGSRRSPSSPRPPGSGWRRRPSPSSSTGATPRRWRAPSTCTRRRSATG